MKTKNNPKSSKINLIFIAIAILVLLAFFASIIIVPSLMVSSSK